MLRFAHYVPGFSQAQKGDFKYLVRFLIRNYVCLAEKIKEKNNNNNNKINNNNNNNNKIIIIIITIIIIIINIIRPK